MLSPCQTSQYRAFELTIVSRGEQIQTEAFVPFVRDEGTLQFVVRLDTERWMRLVGQVETRTNGLFLPTVSAEADLELSAVLHRSDSTTSLKPMSSKPTKCTV